MDAFSASLQERQHIVTKKNQQKTTVLMEIVIYDNNYSILNIYRYWNASNMMLQLQEDL